MKTKLLTVKIQFDNPEKVKDVLLRLYAKFYIGSAEGKEDGYFYKDNCEGNFVVTSIQSELDKMKQILSENNNIFLDGNLKQMTNSICVIKPSKFE